MSCQALIYLMTQRKRVLLNGAVATAALVAGCDTVKVSQQQTGSGSTVAVHFNRAEFERQREEFRRNAEKRIAELDVEMARLNEKAKAATGEAREKIDRELAEQKVNLDKAKVELKEIDAVAGEKWDEFKRRSSKALDDLKQ